MTGSSTPVNTDTHVEELQDTPHIVSIGNIRIDISRVSARDSSRIWDIIIRSAKKQADPEELIPVIVDIIAKQTAYCTLEELLDEGTMEELQAFVGDVVRETMRMHKPILQRHPELFRDAPVKQTEQ